MRPSIRSPSPAPTSHRARCRRGRLEPHMGAVRRDVKARRKNARRARLGALSGAIENAFAGVKQFRLLQRKLERADLPLRAPELLYIGLGVGLFFGLFSAVAFASPLAALVGF